MADLYENNDNNYDFVINLRSEHPSTAEQNIQFPEQWTKAFCFMCESVQSRYQKHDSTMGEICYDFDFFNGT
jgi:hypothetical protein